MGKTIRSIRRAVEAGIAASKEPVPSVWRYRVGDRVIKCSQCGSELFEAGPAFAPMFLGVAIQCLECSHLEFFGKDVLTQVEAAEAES